MAALPVLRTAARDGEPMMVELTAWLAALQLAQATPPAAPAGKKATAPSVDELIVIAPKSKQDPEWASRLNFDLHGRYASSPTPYLRQRPVNGCKLMAGGATPPKLDLSGVASGVVCAKVF
jgi:hypothetical protein